MRLKDKVAIVTGGASGIGKACVERFAQEGATVVIADLQEPLGRKVAESIPGSLFLKVDVADPESVAGMIRQAVEQCGRLDILVNNAGIDGEQAPTSESSIENWQKVIAINLDGVYYGLKYGIAAMKQQGSGAILNTASIAGMLGFPGIPAYTAAKGGVINLTRTAALECAPFNIRVNAICPGVVMTPLVEHFITSSADPEATRRSFENMNPLPGVITTEAIASAALFLVSAESSFITGLALPVDGGYTIR